MRILLVTSSVNPLCSRSQIALVARGHEVSVHAVEAGCSDASLIAVVELARPDLVVAPTLKRILPEAIWGRVTCLIVHPGVRGDRGMSSLDWAIENGERTWGVTLIQAAAEVDSGDIWAWREFPMRDAKKTSLFRHEVSDAALECILEAVDAFAAGCRTGKKLAPGEGRGQLRPPMKQADRAIDWARDDSETVVRKVHAADTSPGVLDRILGQDVFMFGAHHEATLRAGARPGEIFAQRNGAICRATRDGAVWITNLRPRGSSSSPRRTCSADTCAGFPRFHPAGAAIRHRRGETSGTRRSATSARSTSTSTTARYRPNSAYGYVKRSRGRGFARRR